MSTSRPAKKPPIAPEHRAAQERDGDEHHEHEVGHAAEHVHLREDRDLEDRRDEEEHRGLEAVERAHRFFVETSAATASSESKRANGVHRHGEEGCDVAACRR